jgi:hypothetical protein
MPDNATAASVADSNVLMVLGWDPAKAAGH